MKSIISSWLLVTFVTCAFCAPAVRAMSKDDFPLVWVCLGITLVGVILAFFVAYRRPELEVPVPSREIEMNGSTESSSESYEDKGLTEITKEVEVCEPITDTMVLNVSTRE